MSSFELAMVPNASSVSSDDALKEKLNQNDKNLFVSMSLLEACQDFSLKVYNNRLYECEDYVTIELPRICFIKCVSMFGLFI